MPKTPRLREWRERATLSQEDLRERSGISRATIADLEAGNRGAQPRTIRHLAAALGVQPADLYGESEVPKARAAQAPLFDQAEPLDLGDWTKMFRTLADKKRADLADLRRRTEAGGGSSYEWAALTYEAQRAYMDGERLFADVTAATVEGALLVDAIYELGNVASEITAGYRRFPEEARIIGISRDFGNRAAS
jgi:transcriptional regulator with XRE-family HTH domain